eukprot:1508020-Lingulodinium_polyedra.AAC.1
MGRRVQHCACPDPTGKHAPVADVADDVAAAVGPGPRAHARALQLAAAATARGPRRSACRAAGRQAAAVVPQQPCLHRAGLLGQACLLIAGRREVPGLA